MGLQYEGQVSILDVFIAYSLSTSQVKLLSNRSLSPSVDLKETMRDADCFVIHTRQ